MSDGLVKKVLGVNRSHLLLAFLILFHIVNNLIILGRDNTPFLWDGGDYFYRSLRYYDVFANFGTDFVSRFNEVSPYRPPLFLLSSLPFYLFFGRSPDVAVMTNSLYIIILILSIYGLGKRIHSEEVGLMASFVVSTFPIIFGLSRSYWLDFPLTAMVCLSAYLLVRSDDFKDRKYSLLFGLTAGLGMLTKWTYFVFLAGPFLYLLLSSSKRKTEKKENANIPYLNAAFSILAGIGVASFWYIPNGWDVVNKLFSLSVGVTGEQATRFQQLGETIGPSGIFNIMSFSYYPGQLVSHQISFFYAMLFIIFIFFLLKKEREKTIWMLLWIIIPVIAFTLIKNKTIRNTVPMLPAIGLFVSLGIAGIKRKGLKKGLIALIVLFGVSQYMVSSYGSSFLPKSIRLSIPIGNIIFFQQPENTSFALYKADKGDWKADEILTIIDSTRGGKRDIKIVQIPRDAFTWMAMDYSAYLRGLPFTFIGAVDSPESVRYADYVLLKKGGILAPWFLMDNIYNSLDLMEENIEDFKLIKSVVLPEDRDFLPIYDIEATKNCRKSGVVFSEGIEVIGCCVSEVMEGSDREFTVEATLKNLGKMDGEIKILFKLLNKKMEVLMKKPVKTTIPVSEWKAGEVKIVRASLTVPGNMAQRVFSLEMGFYSPAKGKQLTYRPKYLIYKRRG